MVFRNRSLRCVGGLLLALCGTVSWSHATPKDREIQAHFSAGTGCSDELVKTIGTARWFINLQASHQICDPVIRALIEARKRGVQVEVILDKGAKAQTNATADALVKAGVKTYIDAKHGMAHNSLLIVDEGQIVTGSFDFTKAPDDSSSGNILIISDTALTAKFLESWRAHVQHASLYGAKRR
ncbi:MAG TPA: phospholipase D-like domain-containing protein [Opitutaceae bacterium]|nr:phospholipase D-like domain-containing protein [Opitutaceae bacterium]